uniref:Protondependent Oligopeptide Transporter (POT) Family putative n=1 Tax=Albugo laibachii Nc14 TaxID=890382 RepID=F0WVX4_9STRA|nr:Protondependent Oligopeptide Transporter (POT) Family putative [Albugo laibachii Nc14]|eukprot:CCA25575.1 Protondependent Oligopeptide Transporter (POT) Family putative [Albugo laibachii Nc14]
MHSPSLKSPVQHDPTSNPRGSHGPETLEPEALEPFSVALTLNDSVHSTRIDPHQLEQPSMIQPKPIKFRQNEYDNILLHVCSFILILEFAERLSYYGINQGLKNFIDKFGWSQVASNAIKSTWTSICYLSPILGGYIADEKWGRFKTLAVFGIWYTIGIYTVSISALPEVMEYPQLASWLCHCGLFVGVAVGTGAIKANVITFGADQFDTQISSQVVQLHQYFKYFYSLINIGAIFSYGYLSVLCVQGAHTISTKYGYFATFYICGTIMVIAYLMFYLAWPRYNHQATQTSALTELWYVIRGNCEYSFEARQLFSGLIAFILALILNIFAAFLTDSYSSGHYLSYIVVIFILYAMYTWIRYGRNASYMDKSMASNGGKYNDEVIEEIKQLVRVLPFACFMIFWECAYDQLDANFQSITQQCDLRIGAKSIVDAHADQVPGALLGIIDPITIIVFIPALDTIIYPFYTKIVGNSPSAYGKVLVGLIIATFAMMWTGVFEVLRRESGILTTFDPETDEVFPILDQALMQPMNHMYWAYAIPNYLMIAIAECLINVTAYELLYREVPLHLKSACQTIHLLTVAIGSNLTSSFTILFQAHFPQNLNDGNFEYMYYTLAAVGLVNLVFYITIMKQTAFGMNRADDVNNFEITCSFNADEMEAEYDHLGTCKPHHCAKAQTGDSFELEIMGHQNFYGNSRDCDAKKQYTSICQSQNLREPSSFESNTGIGVAPSNQDKTMASTSQ